MLKNMFLLTVYWSGKNGYHHFVKNIFTNN